MSAGRGSDVAVRLASARIGDRFSMTCASMTRSRRAASNAQSAVVPAAEAADSGKLLEQFGVSVEERDPRSRKAAPLFRWPQKHIAACTAATRTAKK